MNNKVSILSRKQGWIFLLCYLLPFGWAVAQTTENDWVAQTESTQESLVYREKSSPLISLKQILSQLEKELDVHVLYESKLLDSCYVEKFVSSSDLSIKEQLLRILRPFALAVQKIADHTYVIIRSKEPAILYGKIEDKNALPLAGATVRIANTNKGTISDLDGHYHLELPPGDHPLEISYVGFNCLHQSIQLQAGDTAQYDFNLAEHNRLQEVVIVGSHLSASKLLEKTEPADIVTTDQISGLGYLSTGQLLQYKVPSFHSTPQSISDGTDHIDPATLRGLGPDQVLVLINGKRRHSSALVNINGTIGRGSVSTDLNAIPRNAIERIEILRDGAAVQYGSDAIAGVINIVLKEKAAFSEITTSTGINQSGDGLKVQLSGSHGFALGRKGGFANVTLDFYKRNVTNRSGNYSGPVFGDQRDESPEALEAFFSQTGLKDQRVMSVGHAASSNASVFYNSELPIGNLVALYSFGGATYRLGKAQGFYRFPYQERRQSGIYTLGFLPEIHADIIDRSVTVGIKSKELPWAIDFSNTTGSNRFDFSVHNSNNASMGLRSPTSVHAGGFNYTQNVSNLNIAKSVSGRIPVKLSLGSEFRLEKYQQFSGEEASWKNYGELTSTGQPKEGGIQVFPGFRPENRTRQYRYNLGLYAGGETELLKSLLLNLATRYEHYSGFGSHFIWKLGSRYKLNKVLTLRATMNSGFRAPSMPQIHFSSRAFQFVSVGDEHQGTSIVHFNNNNPVTRQFGVNALKVETSRNISTGIAIHPLSGLSLTMDAYRIDIDDRIVLTGRVSADQDQRFADILAPVGVKKVQFFTNAIDTRTKGLDVLLNYETNWKKNTLQWLLAANFTQTEIRTKNGQPLIHTSELLKGFESDLFNREEIARIEVGQPRSKLIFSTTYKNRKIDAALHFTRFGAVTYVHPDDGNSDNWVLNEYTGERMTRDQKFSPKWLTDLSIRYRLTNRIAWSVGGNNVFNIYPDKHQHSANVHNGIFIYSRRVQQFGVNGAYWYSQLSFKF